MPLGPNDFLSLLRCLSLRIDALHREKQLLLQPQVVLIDA